MPEVTQLDRIESRLSRIEQKIDATHALVFAELQEQQVMATNLDSIAREVSGTADAEQSAIILLGRLHDLIVAAGTDQTKLDELAASLKSNKEALAAAVVANTPSDTP